MQAFTAARDESTPDELWLTEHDAIYTLGLNRKEIRLPSRNDIPILMVDRGGKITYHGPGQIVIYLLLDLKRLGLEVRQAVNHIENAIIELLSEYGVQANAEPKAPGVYISGKKIAALGLRLKNMRCYHGLSLNVAMDLTPFDAIDPCGYQGLQVTQTQDLGIEANQETLAHRLLSLLQSKLNNNQSLMT